MSYRRAEMQAILCIYIMIILNSSAISSGLKIPVGCTIMPVHSHTNTDMHILKFSR